jgi:aminomethyltransferase
MNKTPLHDRHVALHGRMVEFAGWDMAVQYGSVIEESLSVRNHAGMFDVSHMARLHFRCDAAFDYLQRLTTNDVSKLSDGASQYSLLCYEDGGCVDDIILYRIRQDWFRMVVNASNHEKDVAWLKKWMPDGIAFEDETIQTAMIAVQGPKAVEFVGGLADQDVGGIERFTARPFTVEGCPVFGARTGYTGEDGFELILSAGDAGTVWDALHEAGVAPCGLASRDVLRVEAGLPLYGHELSKDINPIEAGLGWVVGKNKEFIGSGPINAMRAEGPPRKLVGIRMSSKIVPREGYPILKGGDQVGTVTSGVYSPMLECGIAFAFIHAARAGLKEPCHVIIRDRAHEAMMVSKRFLEAV